MPRNHLIWTPDAPYQRLTEIKKREGWPSFGALLNALALEHSEKEAPRADVGTMLSDSRPFIITGPSGSGKTTLAKSILAKWGGPALVFDVSGEYAELPAVKDARDVPFAAGGRVRILADPDESYSAIQGSYLFRDLARARGPELSKWLVIIEEAHRFKGDGNLRNLVLESRKFLGKLLVLSADSSAWVQIAPVVHP